MHKAMPRTAWTAPRRQARTYAPASAAEVLSRAYPRGICATPLLRHTAFKAHPLPCTHTECPACAHAHPAATPAGLYSQVKRAPKAKIKRKTFETPGPAAGGDATTMSLDDRARQLFAYMKNYNYEVKSTGDVITFSGNYRSTRGQAAAITFYMLVGMICCGLVLSIAAPGGNLWYGLVLLTPLAPWYYYKNADRCGACRGSVRTPVVVPLRSCCVPSAWAVRRTLHTSALQRSAGAARGAAAANVVQPCAMRHGV